MRSVWGLGCASVKKAKLGSPRSPRFCSCGFSGRKREVDQHIYAKALAASRVHPLEPADIGHREDS